MDYRRYLEIVHGITVVGPGKIHGKFGPGLCVGSGKIVLESGSALFIPEGERSMIISCESLYIRLGVGSSLSLDSPEIYGRSVSINASDYSGYWIGSAPRYPRSGQDLEINIPDIKTNDEEEEYWERGGMIGHVRYLRITASHDIPEIGVNSGDLGGTLALKYPMIGIPDSEIIEKIAKNLWIDPGITVRVGSMSKANLSGSCFVKDPKVERALVVDSFHNCMYIQGSVIILSDNATLDDDLKIFGSTVHHEPKENWLTRFTGWFRVISKEVYV